MPPFLLANVIFENVNKPVQRSNTLMQCIDQLNHFSPLHAALTPSP